MPHQNRVLPTGEIVAAAWRGAFTGNRGCLHDALGRLGVARWRHQNWVCCLTAFRGRRRAIMPPGRWTALFFWDEACALAAGHRPCGECRHADYRRFVAAWEAAGLPGDGPVGRDRVLHRARVTRDRRQVTHGVEAGALPDGVFIRDGAGMGAAAGMGMGAGAGVALVWRGALWPWHGGYAAPRPLREGCVEVLTPAPVVAVLRAGYELSPVFSTEG